MRSNKFKSLFMLFLTLSANFISLCPASEKQCADVHLFIVSCTAHDCHRALAQQSCAKEDCKHDVCNDKSVLEINTLTQQDLFSYTVPIVFGVAAEFYVPIISSHSIKASSITCDCFYQSTTPLRI